MSDPLSDRARATMLRHVRSEDASVDPETLRRLKIKWLYCLLAQVRDDTPEAIRRNVEMVIQICAMNHGFILSITGSLLFVVFGLQDDSENEDSNNSHRASKELAGKVAENVRTVAFEGEFSYGNIGTDQRMSYTVLVPKFDRFLTALLDTDFGSVTDFGAVS